MAQISRRKSFQDKNYAKKEVMIFKNLLFSK